MPGCPDHSPSLGSRGRRETPAPSGWAGRRQGAGGLAAPVGGVSPPGTAADGAGPAPRGGRAGGACGERASRARAGLGACRAERSERRSVWAAAAACAMAPAADREGYWGPTTSTLDWCEENYAVTWYIAEFCECGRQRPGLRREAGKEV